MKGAMTIEMEELLSVMVEHVGILYIKQSCCNHSP